MRVDTVCHHKAKKVFFPLYMVLAQTSVVRQTKTRAHKKRENRGEKWPDDSAPCDLAWLCQFESRAIEHHDKQPGGQAGGRAGNGPRREDAVGRGEALRQAAS